MENTTYIVRTDRGVLITTNIDEAIAFLKSASEGTIYYGRVIRGI